MTKIIIAVVVALASIAGAFFYGVSVGKDREAATQARIDKAITDTRQAAQQGAAEAISGIKITNTTIQNEVQREIQTNTIYRDCKLPADGLRLANDALKGKRSIPAGSGVVPRTDTTGKQ